MILMAQQGLLCKCYLNLLHPNHVQIFRNQSTVIKATNLLTTQRDTIVLLLSSYELTIPYKTQIVKARGIYFIILYYTLQEICSLTYCLLRYIKFHNTKQYYKLPCFISYSLYDMKHGNI